MNFSSSITILLGLLKTSSQQHHANASSSNNNSLKQTASPARKRSFSSSPQNLQLPARQLDGEETTLCSCSPVKYNFTLNLSQDCDSNDVIGNNGIEGSFCYIEDLDYIDYDKAVSSSSTYEPVRRKRERDLQDKTPVEIISIQFLEFDTQGDLRVIHQDDTHIKDASFKDGDVVSYYSKSSFLDPTVAMEEQMDYVPGGASLILFGKTADGEIVRNRFFWVYTMECGIEVVTINDGDEIGWVTINKDAEAWPAFCPASSPGSPTISPRTLEPTYAPTIDGDLTLFHGGKSSKSASKSGKSEDLSSMSYPAKSGKTTSKASAVEDIISMSHALFRSSSKSSKSDSSISHPAAKAGKSSTKSSKSDSSMSYAAKSSKADSVSKLDSSVADSSITHSSKSSKAESISSYPTETIDSEASTSHSSKSSKGSAAESSVSHSAKSSESADLDLRLDDFISDSEMGDNSTSYLPVPEESAAEADKVSSSAGLKSESNTWLGVLAVSLTLVQFVR